MRDFTTACFVNMPFDKKEVTDEKGQTRIVDFDAIYANVFEPAIRDAVLPEGGKLVPRRTDKDFFAGDISQEMFEYLEYSRMALTDITGLNPNVFYELGVRHRAALLAVELRIDGKYKLLLNGAERSLRAQVSTEPPYDPPWSFFDLAEIPVSRRSRTAGRRRHQSRGTAGRHRDAPRTSSLSGLRMGRPEP